LECCTTIVADLLAERCFRRLKEGSFSKPCPRVAFGTGISALAPIAAFGFRSPVVPGRPRTRTTATRPGNYLGSPSGRPTRCGLPVRLLRAVVGTWLIATVHPPT